MRGSDEERPRGADGVVDSEAATPPSGLAMGAGTPYFAGDLRDASDIADRPAQPPPGIEDETPPSGIAGLSPGVVADSVVSEEDFGRAGPAVLDGPDPLVAEPDGPAPREEPDDWPKLEYRSRGKSRRGGAFDWIRRRDTE